MLRWVRTPLVQAEWEKELREHPDPGYRQYVRGSGFREGGVQDRLQEGRGSGQASGTRNSRAQSETCCQLPRAQRWYRYLQKELSQGRLLGPVTGRAQAGIHISRF